MKSLELQTVAFQNLENGFQQWLQTLGYSKNTVYYLPVHLREFFKYLENNKITTIDKIEKHHTQNYFTELSQRKHKRKPGGLSQNYLNKHIQALRNFDRFVQETNQGFLPLQLPKNEAQTKHIKILTKEEIGLVYQAIDQNPLGERDRAMMGIFYGCGLRREEGTSLDIKDLLFAKGLVYVRKGKNYKERYVPVNKAVATDIQNYIKYGRKQLITSTKQEALFVNQHGKRIAGQSLNSRFKRLMEKAGLQHENIGLHILRHSLATHLMQSGMTIENISRILGHNSLESTQIYTHLAHEL